MANNPVSIQPTVSHIPDSPRYLGVPFPNTPDSSKPPTTTSRTCLEQHKWPLDLKHLRPSPFSFSLCCGNQARQIAARNLAVFHTTHLQQTIWRWKWMLFYIVVGIKCVSISLNLDGVPLKCHQVWLMTWCEFYTFEQWPTNQKLCVDKVAERLYDNFFFKEFSLFFWCNDANTQCETGSFFIQTMAHYIFNAEIWFRWNTDHADSSLTHRSLGNLDAGLKMWFSVLFYRLVSLNLKMPSD